MKLAINTSGLTYGDISFTEFEKLMDVKYFDILPEEELREFISDCDAVIINKVVVDRALLDACPKLKYVGLFATGYNLVDISACRERGVIVCNVPNYSTYSVAQHVFALLLYVYGKIPEYTGSVAAGDWIKSETFCYFPWATSEIYGKTFGIYGYGSIGKRVAEIAKAMGANVIISTRTPPENCPFKCVSSDTLFAESDIVSLHCPLTEATSRLVDARTLSLMKESAVLINTARGGLVDEPALAAALNGGKIAAACLDTVAEEPMRADNPLLGAKNCIITPHMAWTAYETRVRLVRIAAQNLAAFLNGNPQNVVS